MQFSSPVRFERALSYLRSQKTMPTRMRTWALDQLPVEVRERSFFSAGVTKAELLDAALDSIERIVSGDSDRATQRLYLKRVLDSLGYQPDPAKRGTLEDLSSDRRLNLILDTNVSQVRNYGNYQASQDPDILAVYPAQELVRVGGLPFQPRPWRSMWVRAGGTLYPKGGGSRMIARKDDPIWMRSISKGGFNRFGTPYPPFDFNSGMRLKNIRRADAEKLGVLDADDAPPAPDQERMNETLEATPKVGSDALKQAIEASGFGTFDATGKLTFNDDN